MSQTTTWNVANESLTREETQGAHHDAEYYSRYSNELCFSGKQEGIRGLRTRLLRESILARYSHTHTCVCVYARGVYIIKCHNLSAP